MVRQKKPLVMHLQRVLKPYVPADWEDMNAKYYEATIPISLDPFSAPGSVEAKEEVPLVPVPVPQEAEADRNPKKKTAARKAAKSGQPPTMYEEPAADVHPYLSATTTATVELRLRHTLTRLSSDRVRPALTPSQLIPTRSRTQTTGSSQSVSVDFEEAIKDMATHLLKEYYEVNPAEKNAAGDTLDEREARRVRFLDYFQSTGQVLAYKTKISGLVLRIIEEKFHTDPTATPEDVGKLQNELYVFLLEHMHVALQELIDADTARPTGGAPAADRVADSEEGEEGAVPADAPSNIADVWYQRAQEAEMTGELSLASSCHQSRIASYVGSSRYPEMWTDAAAFYTRIGDSAQAEVCYREAIACDPTYLPALLGYGMWLLTYERLGEAAIFLHSAVDLSPEDGLLWAIISLLNSLHIALLKEGSPNYTNEAAKWRREREDSIQQAVQRFKKVDPDATEEKALLRLANYALQLHHRELANICLCQCEAGKREVEIFYARLFVQAEQYREALHTLGELEETEVEGAGSPEEQDELNILRAECEAALGHTQQAITLYKKALCADNEPPAYLKRSQAVLPPSQEAEVPVEAWRRRQFLNAYVRVGNLLLGEGKYRDALGVFAILLQVWPSSLAWLGAGIAYYRSGNLENAEECLAESNVLDPSNPRTWGYLTLLVVRLQTAGVEDTLQQLRLHDLVDPALWAEIGKELLTSNHGSLAVWCLRRALYLDGRAAGGKSHGMHSTLTSTTQYYLAQALVEQREWEEAQELLESVAEHSPNEVLKAKAEEELHQLRSFST
ncbi:hypothetical protein AGDE_08277 [Angomonas deanei]|nr:hypothetical protein AGDE_08277 [Angomonas deanei]|eukprot:EPY33451.1 hypothetical protein AGDE_08277 [Angomonas deanei]